MNRRLNICLFLIICCCTAATAQTIDEVKTLFNNKQYEEALPELRKMVKAQPANANINYWYGESLLRTGNPRLALKPLEVASRRGVSAANLPLGQTYMELYQFDKALTCFSNYKRLLTQQKKSIEQTDRLIAQCRTGQQMMLGVEKVCVVDSFVVDKDNFLDAYKLSKESGSLYYFKDYFKQDSLTVFSTVYETERQNRILYGDRSAEDGGTKLYGRIKTTDDGWSAPTLLPEVINGAQHVNYPFLLDDGVTLYFASDGKGSLGGYDIFITRYDTNTDSYLKPDNIGMPFNSPANDYMMAIDSYHNLGWFATDRYQPSGKVCIYVFVPNASKQVYDAKSMPAARLQQLAQLGSIESTWGDDDTDKLDAARTELDKVLSCNAAKAEHKEGAFIFVIDDSHTYRDYTDFKSDKALELFRSWQQAQTKFNQNVAQLDALRSQYGKADSATRRHLSSSILRLEKQQLEAENQLQQQQSLVRRLEISKLNP